MRTTLTAKWLWDGSNLLENPEITIEGSRIASIASRGPRANAMGDELDFPQATLAPAFVDVHIHGAAGHDVMEATPQALSVIGSFLASRGTGAYLATTVTAPLDTILRSLSGLQS